MIKRFYILLLAIVASVGMSWATTTDLASITDNYTAQDGEILTGTLGVNVKISIADGATVTLLNANINGDKTWTTGEYAGLTCLGDATITIVGKNSVSGFYADELGNGYPGIYVPSGKTLIINGTGSLTAQSSTEEAAGIGARKDMSCGNIEIQSGKITAIASGEYGAGIGGAYNASCGDITISGGIVTAVGGDHCAGIGGGRRGASTNAGHCGNILISGGVVSATSGKHAAAIGGGRGNNNNYKTNCGTITITNTALKVYAEQGGDKGSTNTIGAAKYGNCGAVEIGGNTGVINDDPYTYRTKEDREIVVDYINAIGTVVYTQECKDKIDIARELYDALEDSQKTLVTNYQTLLDAEAAYAALIPQPGPANQLYMEVDGTAGTLKWGLAGSNPVYDGDAIQYSDRKYITTLTIDESCQNHTLTSFYNLFHIFKALTTINGIENLATANVESMRYMFYDCQALTSLDLSSFNTAKVTDMKGMFNGCSNLTTIYVGDDWNTSAVTNGGAMFYGCTNLPNYDSEATGVEKAYVGAGGYLSAMLTPADVMALIAAIGEVEYTAECKAKIDAARAAFDALSAADQALVTNYSTLTDAETAYADAKQAADQAVADPVIAQINALPTAVKLSTYDLMVAAREAYDALNADQKALVPAATLTKLTDLEAAFAAIGGGAGPEELLTTITVDAGEVNYTVADVVNLDQSGASLGQDGWTSG
ncbi:MAG: BspA family leucine-rich repeat surface protein, partial [Paludibacteraceae bacterium]|nr:BspA family leucine-rich repeat surface protein [Paludibacteraceae bacterium]